MNPPPALFGAMGRERKPFTYTPGGLDLSEIKSERMAQRLMRNAMNQGVPETPANSVRSPPASGIPTAIPNFNCLPVQVFPSFQLPANPKSLLRTRSNPDGAKEIHKPVRQFNEDTNVNKQDINRSSYPNGHERFDSNTVHFQNTASNIFSLPKTNGSNLNKGPTIYEEPSIGQESTIFDPSSLHNKPTILEMPSAILSGPRIFEKQTNNDCETDKTAKPESNILAFNNTEQTEEINVHTLDEPIKNDIDVSKNKTYVNDTSSENKNEQEETSVTESSTLTENKTLSQNGDTETAVVVKLPTKKSAAKTETKVEVVQKSLPDGSVQEIKTTTTKTTIDGKTEISTKTETKTISKEETDEEIYEEEEEECEAENVKTITSNSQSIENGTVKETKQQNGEIIKQEEKSETSTTKKVVVIQSEAQESEEEVEEVEEEEEVEVEEENDDEALVVEEVLVLKKQSDTKSVSNESEDKNSELEKTSTKENVSSQESEKEDNNQSEEECEIEEEDDNEIKESDSKDKDLSEDEDEKKESSEKGEADEAEDEDDETEEQNLDVNKNETTTDTTNVTEETTTSAIVDETVKSEAKSEEVIIPIQTEVRPNEKIRTEVLREPAVPLEKVEEVEIKPIGAPAQEIITKSHKEIISTTTDKPSALSTQTEYNVIENIVTVNRTTKTLDHAYEQAGEYTVPVVKTSLIPDNSGALPPPPPIFNRTYQTSYSQEPTTERRHSLLLERLSVERQLPTSNIYHTDNTHTNNAYDSRQLYGEPQSEIVIENNVKPSMVNKNQQWYSKKDNYDYATTGSSIPSQQWNQPKSQPQTQAQYQPPVQPQYQPQPQSQYQPQPQYQSQPQYQPQTQTQYQSQYEYTPQSQSYSQSINLQSQYTSPQSQQNSYNESYKSSIQNNYSQNSYSSYTPKPSWVNSTVDPKPTSLSNQYSYETDSYQKSSQNQTSYVPPPWEQDSGYANNFTQNTYQPQTPTTPLPTPTSSWKAPNAKFPKATSYVPPAPNQSFVKPVSAADQPRLSGRKTYYSEYERRYITVPESTYIPTETKFQAQPDPSPQYYYDQNEPVETVEPQWRKELREFTEKTQTSSYTDSSVRPPWEEEPKYVSEQTNTRTWSQTLRPRSFRERSVETDYNSTAKEWSKSNSLGRGRPQSSYVNNLKRIPERTRGVSVDRYNPNVYQSPVMGEHPPVQSQTLDPAIHPKPHYNPNVPAYHSRASAEPREQTYSQPKWDSRAPPVQSRSFKYLQWITGTED